MTERRVNQVCALVIVLFVLYFTLHFIAAL